MLDEFRDMVKALHRAGIEVILDVVYNHTAEGLRRGATLCYRGAWRTTSTTSWTPTDKSRYADYTGCGNTLNAEPRGGAPPDPRQPALLGAARCMSTVSVSTWPPC